MNKISIILFIAIIITSCVQQQSEKQKSKIFSVEGKKVTIYTSAYNTDMRLSHSGTLQFENATQPKESEVAVFVNPKKQFQSFLGIGGAITDASAEVFAALPEEKQEELLNAYYSKEEGIGYTLLRVPIHSCDFSSASFTYIEEGDKDLKTFSIEHDLEYKIPLIKKAITGCRRSISAICQSMEPACFYEKQ